MDKDFYNVRQNSSDASSKDISQIHTWRCWRSTNCRVGFDTEAGLLVAVDGVSFTIEQGKTLGLVGESGCGKSVTADLDPAPRPNPPGGSWRRDPFRRHDILKLKREELPKIRGKDIAMIFQDPMTRSIRCSPSRSRWAKC